MSKLYEVVKRNNLKYEVWRGIAKNADDAERQAEAKTGEPYDELVAFEVGEE